MSRWGVVLAVVLAAVGAGCGHPAPRALKLGEESCTHCHMTLEDPRFGAELVTTTGKVLAFDDAGCLATFLSTGGIPAERIHSLWVSDFLQPDSLIETLHAVFLQTDRLHSPMGYGLVAFSSRVEADSLRAALGGRLLEWNGVLERLRQTGPR